MTSESKITKPHIPSISTKTPKPHTAMSRYSIPGLRKIQIIRCKDLPSGLMLHSICGCIVAIVAPAVSVEFVGRPVLRWEGSKVNGTRQENSTLEFSTVNPLPEGEKLAFVVTTAAGKQYLIGAREGCAPIINYSDSTGEPGGSAAVRSYKITHVAQKSVLPCVL
ncbi:MAG: hypothetical protein K2H17_06065 [Duncaniella sp.]|nr:hypothetical protein [Duncaniella sp.]